MDKPSFKLVGAPCGQHGQYTFYKALRVVGKEEKIVAIGDFFFVRVWQDSELVSIGELQLLWTDRVSDQTLVSLRLYVLPENTPDGRNLHGEDEVLAINDKVVIRADDLMSWICFDAEWRWGLRAVWRGACAPPSEAKPSAPLHHTKLDFSDVDKEKNAIEVDSDAPGVVVFSYPRYCRYRALLSRLEGIQADWLRDSLVAALGGYAAPTNNTRILYCKDTFEYPELEGHEFVCNHLAPRLKGRPRGRRRRTNLSPSPDRSDASDATHSPFEHVPTTPRRLSLRNGAPEKHSEEEENEEVPARLENSEDKAFVQHLKHFYRNRNMPFKSGHTLKDLSLRALYQAVTSRGGYEAVCRHKLWRALAAEQPARTRRHYERFLLHFENHERRNIPFKINGKIAPEPQTIATIDVTDSPLREGDEHTDKLLRTPSPKREKIEKIEIDNETGELTTKDEINVVNKNAEEFNREFLDSLPKDDKAKISVKPVEKLIEPAVKKLFEEKGPYRELTKSLSDPSKALDKGVKDFSHGSTGFFSELAHKLNLGNADTTFLKDLTKSQVMPYVPQTPLNGHTPATTPSDQKSGRPLGRSSLRSVRVKPARALQTPSTTPPNPLRPDSASSSPPLSSSFPLPPNSAPPVTNFGIHHPPRVTSTNTTHSDDEIVEVPYIPKTPEIIDLDEYPESPQAVKKKKLDILKERGLEVTALPTPTWPAIPPQIITPQIMLNPAVQHQIMTQAQLFQMYNIIPPNYANGIQPPKIVQGSSIFGSAGPEKTVYGNPKDPFMPPPHVLHGPPVKPLRSVSTPTIPKDILDLTCKSNSPPTTPKPAVEILRLNSTPSPQNLTKNYSLIDGKAVVGSNLEITLVNKSPSKNKPPQKRSSNGKFVSAKTPTPPKESFNKYTSPTQKKPTINIPNYQIREASSPTSSNQSVPPNPYKNQNLAQIMDLQKGSLPMTSFMDPYLALYNSVATQMDQRQLAMYRDLMANQFRSYPSLLNLGLTTPTTKN